MRQFWRQRMVARRARLARGLGIPARAEGTEVRHDAPLLHVDADAERSVLRRIARTAKQRQRIRRAPRREIRERPQRRIDHCVRCRALRRLLTWRQRRVLAVENEAVATHLAIAQERVCEHALRREPVLKHNAGFDRIPLRLVGARMVRSTVQERCAAHVDAAQRVEIGIAAAPGRILAEVVIAEQPVDDDERLVAELGDVKRRGQVVAADACARSGAVVEASFAHAAQRRLLHRLAVLPRRAVGHAKRVAHFGAKLDRLRCDRGMRREGLRERRALLDDERARLASLQRHLPLRLRNAHALVGPTLQHEPRSLCALNRRFREALHAPPRERHGRANRLRSRAAFIADQDASLEVDGCLDPRAALFGWRRAPIAIWQRAAARVAGSRTAGTTTTATAATGGEQKREQERASGEPAGSGLRVRHAVRGARRGSEDHPTQAAQTNNARPASAISTAHQLVATLRRHRRCHRALPSSNESRRARQESAT